MKWNKSRKIIRQHSQINSDSHLTPFEEHKNEFRLIAQVMKWNKSRKIIRQHPQINAHSHLTHLLHAQKFI
jgi:hypothetical protein